MKLWHPTPYRPLNKPLSFGGIGLSTMQDQLIQSVDFFQPTKTPLSHNKLIYGVNIASRLWASRGANETWEIIRRDGLGWVFWFFTTPLIQRGWVALAPKNIRQALLTETQCPTKSVLSKWLWRFNPLYRWHLTSSEQIKGYLLKPRYANQRAFLNRLRLWRAGASGIGLLTAFFALGVGINLINIALTRKNVQEGQ